MTLVKNGQNGGYVINKKTGVSLALVIVLAGALTFYFTAQSSLEARINTKLDLLNSVKISKDDHRVDMGLLREDLSRIERKIDRLIERE